MWSFKKPYHWQSNGQPDAKHIVLPLSAEAMAIANYFYEAMPQNTELTQIERWESQKLFLPYAAYKETVRANIRWKLEDLESWLFHGTDHTEDILHSGFSSGNVNLKLNKYGAGVYFARDPRLAHFFVRESRGQSDAEFKILLCRVVVGWCECKHRVRNRDVALPENRKAPDGSHSVTSWDMPGREIVVFPGNPGTPAYPEYILTYKTGLQSDPYKDGIHLLTLSFSNREHSHVFNRYRRQYRPHWCLTQSRDEECDNPQEASRVSAAARESTCSLPKRDDGRKNSMSMSPFLKPLLGDWYVCKEGNSVKISVSYQIGNEYEGNPILETSCEVGASQRIWLQDREVYLEKLVLDKEACSARRIVWKVPKQACCHELWYRDPEKCRPEPVEDVNAKHDWNNPASLSPLLTSLLGDWYFCSSYFGDWKSDKITVSYRPGNECKGTAGLKASYEGAACLRIWLRENDVFLENLVLDKEACSMTRIVWKLPEQACPSEVWHRDSECRSELVEDEHVERDSHRENIASLLPVLAPLIGNWYAWTEGRCLEIKVSRQSGQQILVASCEGFFQVIKSIAGDVYLEKTLIRDKETSSITRIVWKAVWQGCSAEIWYTDPEECRQEHQATVENALQPLVGRWKAFLMGRNVEIVVTGDIDENGEYALQANCEVMNVCRTVKLWSRRIVLDDLYILDKTNSKNKHVIWQDIMDFRPMETWKRADDQEWKADWLSDEQEGKTDRQSDFAKRLAAARVNNNRWR